MWSGNRTGIRVVSECTGSDDHPYRTECSVQISDHGAVGEKDRRRTADRTDRRDGAADGDGASRGREDRATG